MADKDELEMLLGIENTHYKAYRKLKDSIEVVEPRWVDAMKAVDAWYRENASWELILEPDGSRLFQGSYEDCRQELIRIKKEEKLSNLVSCQETRFFWTFEMTMVHYDETTGRTWVEERSYRIAVVKGEPK